jgi:hypothetical protein
MPDELLKDNFALRANVCPVLFSLGLVALGLIPDIFTQPFLTLHACHHKGTWNWNAFDKNL